jgi:hypothetical protein
MNKRKISIIASSVVIISVTTYILINRHKKKLLYEELMTLLQSGEGSGKVEDEVNAVSKSGAALDPKMWRDPSSKGGFYKVETATAMATKIYGMIHGTFGSSDEEGLLQYFKGILSQKAVSEIAEMYQTKYKVSLVNDIQYIDESIFGLQGIFGNQKMWSLQIFKAIKALPNK